MNDFDCVTLNNGATVPVCVVRLAMRLEGRGLSLSVDGEDLVICPGGKLTTDERADIRRWKTHLMALASYEAVTI